MEINREWSMPNKKTFAIKPIRELLIKIIKEYSPLNEIETIVVIDPFANEGTISQENIFEGLTYISNDLDAQYDTDYNLEATDFLKKFNENSVDIVLYDPPYSPRQLSEVYKKQKLSVNMQTTQSSYWGNHKKEISRIVKIGGKVVTFGWNSGGMGKTNNFEIEEILMVAHGGWHNDTICTVDRKI